MTIGQNIKRLRRNADMTQEELAEMLSISSQAVSRWETDSAMPDISLLPALVNIFGVTSDELLGIDESNVEKKVEEIRKKADNYSSRGYNDEALKIIRDGLKIYPSSYALMRELMYLVMWESDRDDKYSESERNKLLDETIHLGEAILNKCTIDSLRHDAIQCLCTSYKKREKKEKAIALAQTMPSLIVSQECLMPYVLDGTAAIRSHQEEIYGLLNLLVTSIHYSNYRTDEGIPFYTSDEHAQIREKAIKLIELMFENSDYEQFSLQLFPLYEDQADYYAKLHQTEETINSLKNCCSFAIQFCKNEKSSDHTSLLFRGIGANYTWIAGSQNNFAAQLSEHMKKDEFDFLRENLDFIKIESELEQYAKKWSVVG